VAGLSCDGDAPRFIRVFESRSKGSGSHCFSGDNEMAFEFLQSMVGTKFDSDCVAALMSFRHEVEAIQKRFREDHFG
jgi:hypothetical protein